MAGLLGNMDNLRGILAQPSTNDFALALLANSGYSPRRRGLGEIIGQSMLQSRQMAAEQAQQKLREQYMRAQMEAMQQRQPTQEELAIVIGEDGKPVYVPRSQAIGKSPYEKPTGEASQSSLMQAYLRARAEGYNGDILQYQRDVARMTQSPGAAAQRPAAITTYEYLRNLPPDEQAAMLGSMRAQQVVPIAGVPNVITPTGTRPLSTPEAETAAKRDAARATAEGTAQVEGQGKKNAVASMNYVIGEMRKQIDSTLQGGPMGLTGMVGPTICASSFLQSCAPCSAFLARARCLIASRRSTACSCRMFATARQTTTPFSMICKRGSECAFRVPRLLRPRRLRRLRRDLVGGSKSTPTATSSSRSTWKSNCLTAPFWMPRTTPIQVRLPKRIWQSKSVAAARWSTHQGLRRPSTKG